MKRVCQALVVPVLLGLAAVSHAQPAAELVPPLDPTPVAAAGWEFDAARCEIIPDEIANAPAFQLHYVRNKPNQLEFTSREVVRPPAVLEAEVRLPFKVSELKKGLYLGSATLGLVESGKPAATAVRHLVTISRGRFLDGRSYVVGSRSGSEASGLNIKPRYTMADCSPLADENVRPILERTVPLVPLAHLRIHRLRVELRTDSVRMYVNGRLAGEYRTAVSPGKATLTLVQDARLLSLRVRPLEPAADRFVTVPLDDCCNATGPAGAASRAGGRVRILSFDGVPLLTSTGFHDEDNLNVGACTYVNRTGTYYLGDSRRCVIPPEEIEATRFTLRVPARPYRRAWVLAAAEDKPNCVPVLTVRFYTPRTPWVSDVTVRVPTYVAATAPGGACRVALDVAGKSSLWLIPIELDAAALAADPMSCLELAKAIYPYRSWPDPGYYNSYPGGLPSGVHVYGLTLESAPLWARGTSTNEGNLFTDPEKPKWRVLLRNLGAAPLDTDVKVLVTDSYGASSEHKQHVALAANGKVQELGFDPPAKVFGLFTVRTTVTAGDFQQSRDGTFLRLPKSTRTATAANSPWGLWSWLGGHTTQSSLEECARWLKALGAINNFALDYRPDLKKGPVSLYEFRKEHGLGPMHYRLVSRNLPDWAMKDPYDPAGYAAFAEEKGKEAAEQLRLNPDLQYVNLFAESAISLRMTHGMPPSATGQPYFDMDRNEAARLRAHWLVAKAATEGVRKYAPALKVLFGHCAANFEEPFFRLDDWNNDRFDGFGMDLPQFERMPERQPRSTEPSLLYFLHKQMREKGLAGKDIVHLESYFPPAGPQALSFGEQADSVVRTAVLSMALGTTRFMRTWSLDTCGDGWGGSHYGSCGMIDRAPEFNPKPCAAAFATMTQVLDLAKYDGWLPTGSRSAYCVRFKDKDRLVYALWTIRGTRPVELAIEGAATRYDQHGNAFAVPPRATVTLSPSPQWIVVRDGSIRSAAVGKPAYTEAPARHHKLLDGFESADWRYDRGVFERYQNNHWDMPREPGRMRAERRRSEDRGSKVFRVELAEPDAKKPMVGFYGVFIPPKPIEIPGKAKALGIRVNGHSAWNRFIYEVTDAKGEKWISCGTHDVFNCDDIHSWSSVNHDGWRYMSFPLPGSAPGDNFREADNVWWGSDAEGIVDLPLRLTRLVVEMRPQMVYVDQMLPINDLSIELDDLTAEYASAEDMTDAPVKSQRAAAAALGKQPLPQLPNPYAELQKTGVGSPPKIAKVYPPEQFYNGTRLYVEVEPVEGAARYRGYVAAYPDGRGAQPLAVDQKVGGYWGTTLKTPNMLLFDRLRPATPLYFFVTTLDAAGKESKPSVIRKVLLKDEFPFK